MEVEWDDFGRRTNRKKDFLNLFRWNLSREQAELMVSHEMLKAKRERIEQKLDKIDIIKLGQMEKKVTEKMNTYNLQNEKDMIAYSKLVHFYYEIDKAVSIKLRRCTKDELIILGNYCKNNNMIILNSSVNLRLTEITVAESMIERIAWLETIN